MSKRRIKIGLALITATLIVGLSACESVGFYSQVVQGHSQIMLDRKPIETVVKQPETDEALRNKLKVIQQARQFAVDTLKLPDNGSYTQYVDAGRRYVVWNVVATEAYSTRPIEHCFPVAGCVSYRGYFKKAAAEAYAEKLKKQGYDVIISGASAYSTLGWFSDPVVNTMLYRSDLGLAGLVFHELSHQQVYTAGDTAFNESFATTVELAGVEAWAAASSKDQVLNMLSPENLSRYKASKAKSAEVVKLILEHRNKLTKAYQSVDPSDEVALKNIKQSGLAELRKAYVMLRANGGGSSGFDRWFDGDLNNASLVLFGDYHGWVDAFNVLQQQTGGDWTAFYQRVQALADLDKAARRQQLELLQQQAKAPVAAQ